MTIRTRLFKAPLLILPLLVASCGGGGGGGGTPALGKPTIQTIEVNGTTSEPATVTGTIDGTPVNDTGTDPSSFTLTAPMGSNNSNIDITAIDAAGNQAAVVSDISAP